MIMAVNPKAETEEFELPGKKYEVKLSLGKASVKKDTLVLPGGSFIAVKEV